VDVEPKIAEAFEHYMRGKHIPEILATGCFCTVEFQRASPTRFRASYCAASQAELDRYLAGHTAHFRADFLDHFPEGAVPHREVWTVREAWEA
jgi:hypothetical protein